jgi:hypothetical protein
MPDVLYDCQRRKENAMNRNAATATPTAGPRPEGKPATRVIHSIALLLAAVIGFALSGHSFAQRIQVVTVYKTATCGCCKDWVKHLEANGFRVDSHDVSDLDRIKSNLGVRPQYASCHTAIADGYTLEGHVPADDIKRLLAERPKGRGLAVPGMPGGAPGMESAPKQPYATLLLDDQGGARVYAQH